MKKLNVALALAVGLITLPLNRAHAENTDGKYWAFWQNFQKHGAKEGVERQKKIFTALVAFNTAQVTFEKSCKKNNAPKCRTLLENLLKQGKVVMIALKEVEQHQKRDFAKALRDAKKL